MSEGLFSASCPDCGAQLNIEAGGRQRCSSCAAQYLERFGYLIVVDAAIPGTESAEADADGVRARA